MLDKRLCGVAYIVLIIRMLDMRTHGHGCSCLVTQLDPYRGSIPRARQ